jgi:hypothetical protein
VPAHFARHSGVHGNEFHRPSILFSWFVRARLQPCRIVSHGESSGNTFGIGEVSAYAAIRKRRRGRKRRRKIV